MEWATSLLKRIPLLASLSDLEAERLFQGATMETAAAGETILSEGNHGDRMYIIAAGTVQVWAKAFDGSDLVLARLGQGDYFGEQALLPGGDGRRNASVRALEPTRLLTISRESLQAALGTDASLLKQFREIAVERNA